MPKELSSSTKKGIKDEFWHLYDTLNLDLADNVVRKVLLTGTIEGRAREGHGKFIKKPCPNITREQVIDAVRLNSYEIRSVSQKLIDEVIPSFENLFYKRTNKLVNKKGKPLFRVGFLEDLTIEHDKETFKGSVLAARMDASKWREQTENKYKISFSKRPLQIGRGCEYPIDYSKLEETTISELESEAHSPRDINELRKKGIITSEKNPDARTQFIRHEEGLGVCDDAALMGIGYRHGVDAMTLAFIIDAVDTYGKFTIRTKVGGLDEYVGEHIGKLWQEKYHSPLTKPEEAMEIIYFAHKNNSPKIPFSSSHRRFIEHESGCKKPTFMMHRDFVDPNAKQEMETKKSFSLGFERFDSETFYRRIEKRKKEMKWNN